MNLGFAYDAARYLIDDQSITSLDTLRQLTDSEITDLCKACRKYGTNTRTRQAAQAAAVIPGIGVPMIVETNLKLASFFLKFKAMTSRTVSFVDVTANKVRALQDFKTEIESLTDPDIDQAPPFNEAKLFEFFDELATYLNGYIGSVSKRPLGYVIRDASMVPPSADDPPFGEVDTIYRDYYHEIENRAPIKVNSGTIAGQIIITSDPHFAQDNVAVWKILFELIKGTHHMSYVKPFVKKKDGRGAVKALHDQLLGKQALNNYASSAENKLQTLRYTGRTKRGWSFNKFVTSHLEQHAILHKLKDFGHTGIDETSKIRHFQSGMQDPALQICKSTINATPDNHKTFTAVVETYRTAIQTNRTFRNDTQHHLNISSTGTRPGNSTGSKSGNLRRNNRYNGPTAGDDGFIANFDYTPYKIKDRWYKDDEWIKFSKNNRNYIRMLRRQGVKGQPPPSARNNNSNKRDHSTVSEVTKNLLRRIAALEQQTVDDDSSTSSTESESTYAKVPRKKKAKNGLKRVVRK